MNTFFDVGIAMEAAETATKTATENSEPSLLLIILLGFGTVFVGLICLIFIIKIYSLVCTRFLGKGKKQKAVEAVSAVETVEAVQEPIINRQQVIAACAAAIATVMGTDVEAIRIKSFRKVN